MSSADRKRRRRALVRRDGDTCAYCHRTFGGRPFGSRSLDHVIPRSRGGSDALDNLLLCCRACNHDKDDQPVDEFLAARAAA